MVVLGTLQLAGSGCNGWGGANYVPLLGSAIGALGTDMCVSASRFRIGGNTLIYGVEYASSVVQILGFILFVVGLTSKRQRPRYDATWEVAPGIRAGVGDAPGGASFILSF